MCVGPSHHSYPCTFAGGGGIAASTHRSNAARPTGHGLVPSCLLISDVQKSIYVRSPGNCYNKVTPTRLVLVYCCEPLSSQPNYMAHVTAQFQHTLSAARGRSARTTDATQRNATQRNGVLIRGTPTETRRGEASPKEHRWGNQQEARVHP